MRRFLVGIGETVSRLGITIAAACLIAIVAINGTNVVARYVFNAPFSWAEEAMVFITIAGVFWGAIAVAWREIDIRIDAFVNRATGRARQSLRVVTSLISIVIVSCLFFVGSRVTLQLQNFDLRSTALNIPMWIPHAAFATGILLVILMMLARLIAPARSDDQTPDHGG